MSGPVFGIGVFGGGCFDLVAITHWIYYLGFFEWEGDFLREREVRGNWGWVG